MFEISLHRIANNFSIDASGSVLSYVGGEDDADTRWLVPLDGSSPPIEMDGGTNSFVWSGDEPLTAAWLEPDVESEDNRIVVGEFTGDQVAAADEVGFTAGFLAGINSTGYWTVGGDPQYPRTGFVEFTPRADDEAWRTSADLVIPAAHGRRALLAHLDTASWRWNFGVGPDRIEPLSWAPGDAAGDHGFAAFSPNAVQIAFIGSDDRGLGWLEVHSTVGAPAERLVLPYRVWDVRWSERGDYVVMPGTDNRGTHVVIIADARTSTAHEPYVYAVELEDWVQFAAVVDPETSGVSAGGPATG